jgi:hypothetical protein
MDLLKIYTKQRCINFLILLLDPLLINSKQIIINYLKNNYNDNIINRLILLLETNNNIYIEYDKLFKIIIYNDILCNFIIKMSNKIYSY